jgi:hypothetical protein
MSERLYVGTRKGLFVWTHDAGGWKLETVHFLGEPVSMVLPSPHDGLLYAGLHLGHFGAKLRRLRPGAKQWEECAVPVYPEGAEVNAGPPIGDAPPKRKPASLSEIWSLESGGPDEPGVLWAGTIPGGLFRSTDQGASWKLIESLWNVPERWRWFGGGKDDPGIHSISVDPRDSRRVTIAISCGSVWHTADSGATWELRGKGLRAEYMPPNLANDPVSQDAHRVVSCTRSPETLWMQHHNGVFHSADGGLNWRELETPRPSPFGFTVAVHPHDPKTAWFVPAADDQCRVPVDARFVVSRTRDGGASFDVLTRGLPQEHAYDIVFRHALDVNRDGEVLATGSSTGGLWASGNAGDDWTCLSHTLPQVYCVRFAK